MKELKLTKPEIAHLYLLLVNNENENFCYGNPTDWWDKHLSIKEKIQELISKGD